MTQKQINELAIDFRAGQIFTDRHCSTPEDVGMVFMPLLLADKDLIQGLKKNPPALIYEYMSKAGPRSINGMPMFTSFRVLNKDELSQVQAIVRNLAEAEKQALVRGRKRVKLK